MYNTLGIRLVRENGSMLMEREYSPGALETNTRHQLLKIRGINSDHCFSYSLAHMTPLPKESELPLALYKCINRTLYCFRCNIFKRE